MKGHKHRWTYEENEYCVEEVFTNFVLNREYNFDSVVKKIFIHFDEEIKRSSIMMKLANIKYLLEQYNVSNTLMVKPLEHVSQDNIDAFFTVAKKYNMLHK